MASTLQSRAPTDIIIREVGRSEEIRAVEEIQKEVWGLSDLDVIPFTQLVAAKAAGGVLLGAFDGRTLAGFVYGFAGYEGGHATHHSHMLAVKPTYRNLNLGYRLKRAQRDFVVNQGVTEMTWTFDPLQSLNAYFNIGRLGAISDRYMVDFYGTDASSFLHRTGTDRLWVTWQLMDGCAVPRHESVRVDPDLEPPVELVSLDENDGPLLDNGDRRDAVDQASIEIPTDINRIAEQRPELATAWRNATRAAFTQAFTAGYVAVEFIRGGKAGKYLLRRKTPNLEGTI